MHHDPDLSKEITDGKGLYLAEAAKLLPRHRQNRPVAPSTVFRWVIDGIRLENGQRIRLEAVRLAGRYVTSREALARFLDRQSGDLKTNKVEPIRTPAQRSKANQRATEKLQQTYGI